MFFVDRVIEICHEIQTDTVGAMNQDLCMSLNLIACVFSQFHFRDKINCDLTVHTLAGIEF